ncbi:YARHG domain-containing protein [Tenacibaculum piscium]|uniref:YARHG domain-containing protein n=1 Tax=Tenacibaculum piscium TaxID=1458515 RepID=UPI001EFB17F2|nr:YARHG domain-containing protein [Tenacibaculum piscium]MCG8182709.1 YARHG domain-containing protein [Tenacibaculum piscium]MCG8204101.1 YARHG domain-containing protein [Tenacibaculum piscium]
MMILQLKYKKNHLLFTVMTLLVLTSCGSDVEISSKTQKLKLIEALQTIKNRDNSENSLFTMLGNMKFSVDNNMENRSNSKEIKAKSIEEKPAGKITNNGKQPMRKFVGLYPIASERTLTHYDMKSLTKKDLKIMRNEIFARHGYIFKPAGEMDNYFRNINWYVGKNNNVDYLLTNIERKNIKFIQTYEKKSNVGSIGYINGTDIIMREGYSSQYKIMGSFKNAGEKVAILDKYISKKETILIKKKITVTDRDDKEHVLEKGKSIEIVAVNPEFDDDILISFKDKNGKRKEGMVYSKTHLDYVKTYWYKVKRNSGEIGWVFGKFITIQ